MVDTGVDPEMVAFGDAIKRALLEEIAVVVDACRASLEIPVKGVLEIAFAENAVILGAHELEALRIRRILTRDEHARARHSVADRLEARNLEILFDALFRGFGRRLLRAPNRE